ncbi:MAG: DUF47 family protein [Planctomycetota bacterium]|nr:DUF47 family protein [Planctomycetota bacterium]
MLFWRQRHPVAVMMNEYITKAEECLELFRRAFETYFALGQGSEFDEAAEAVHLVESGCDDLRRKIEAEVFTKSLIPESRGDILTLIERLDKVPSKADALLQEMRAEMLAMPAALTGKFRQLVHTNCECFQCLGRAVRELFLAIDRVPTLAEEIDKRESLSDRLEREIIRLIFSDAALAADQRILLKALAVEISRLSDLAENAADALVIVAVKRMV